MQFKLQLIGMAEDGREEPVSDIAFLDKDCERIEQLGLTLAESKAMLQATQQALLEQQAATFLRTRACCPRCGAKLSVKGHHTITFRTLSGNIDLASPRLRTCPCQPQDYASFSPLAAFVTERTVPELQFMETKWASLVSYGMTVKALQDFLPVDEKLNATTVRNHTLAVAERCEAALGEERVFFIDGCPYVWEQLLDPEGPITVGIDGGYVRHWTNKKTNFEVIVGKSVPTDRTAKCFGFVQNYDTKPKRRLFELLTSQGMQYNQEICFMSDGEDTVQQLQWYLNPRSEHVLDWFHITMRITVLGQFVKGVVKLDSDIGSEMEQALARTKWKLWHGNVPDALEAVGDIELLLWNVEETYPKFQALKKCVYEFQRYIERNRHMIVNYGERWRAGEVISTAFVESTVNSLLDKRFTKKQQMQWTPKGAHLLLQTRTHVINDELSATFKRWYPDFQVQELRLAA
jgi:hypothetical protein